MNTKLLIVTINGRPILVHVPRTADGSARLTLAQLDALAASIGLTRSDCRILG